MMKKALSIILSVILLLTIIPVGTISAGAAEDDVIEIRTIAELFSINNNMSGNYKLMNDIDMTEDTAVGGDWDFMGNGWEPIGSNGVYGDTPFTGTFDGNGHKIIGMRISRDTTPSGTGTISLGLFAKNDGIIQNLGIDETSMVANGDYSGGICAYNNGTILNCYNKAVISFSNYSGGICAYNSCGISNCYNEADISSRQYSGGICGYSKSGELISCYNIGDISSSSTSTCFSGGICGENNSVIQYCSNIGSITSISSSSGNSDPSYSSTARSCVYCGGICGVSSKEIKNCYNTGELSSKASSFARYGSYSNTKYYSRPSGSASAYSYAFTGGICGKQSTGDISNCYNTASISAEVSATALCHEVIYHPSNYSGTTHAYYTFSSSTKEGTTEAIKYNGGIAGESGGKIIACYNVGETIYGIQETGSGSISMCYYLSSSGKSNTGAKALSSAQLQLEMCMPDFDFENIWVIDKVTEYKYPQLISNRQEEALNPESIEITLPDKISYQVGEEFDPSGLIVIGHYYNDITQEIKTYKLSEFTGELGKNNITVTVGEKTAVFYVTVHDEGEWKTEKEPTCTENGEKKLYCTDCGALLNTEEIPAKGHTEVTDKGHEATCTESGLTDGSHCSVCNTIIKEQEIIPAKGHTPYLNWETIKTPTCIAHGEKVRYCSVCGEVAETADIDVTDHQPVIDEGKEATCLTSGLTEGSHCAVCHTVLVPQEVIQPKGHSWDDGEVVTYPACTATGEKVYHCKNCGQTKSETIPILGHDYSDEFTVDKEATCTEDGLKSRHCSRCDSVTDKTAIPKTEHHPSSEWTVVKEVTTTEEGLEEKHCIDCGAVLDSRPIPKLPQFIFGDADGDGEVTIFDATCIQRHLASIPAFSYNEAAADTDGDGEVTILDATCIQRWLASLPSPEGIGKPIT